MSLLCSKFVDNCLAEDEETHLFLKRGLYYQSCKHVDGLVKASAFPWKLESMLRTNYSASTCVCTANLATSIMDMTN